MSPLVRYSLLQIPGFVLVCLVVALLYHHNWLEGRGALLVVGLWVLKDILLYPIYGPALDNELPASGPGHLIGRRGTSRTAINGRGLVEIGGERWIACSDDGAEIVAGTPVEVAGAEGMLLRVRAVSGPPGDSARGQA